MVRPEFDQFSGFQAFLRQAPEQLEDSARRLLAAIESRSRDTGAGTFVISNEQYLENVPRLAGFFRTLLQAAEIEVVIFVRPPASWLPSAYIQWGVVHKTNSGPVRKFGVKARELMRQYEFIRQWRDLLGSAVTVHAFDDGRDIVQDFASVLGINLTGGGAREQMRPSLSETLMRAACNNVLPQMALPDVYNQIRRQQVPNGTPTSISAKFAHIFGYEQIPQIITEHVETLSYIEREFGVDLTSQPVPAVPDLDMAGLTNDLVGAMLDLVFSQSAQIAQLRARLDKLEVQGAQG